MIPTRTLPIASTVCSICAAIYPARDVHTCTYETPEGEGEPMPNIEHPDKMPVDQPYITPGDRNRHQDVRLGCLRLAAETGMPVTDIKTTAEQWATWVLGGNQKEN